MIIMFSAVSKTYFDDPVDYYMSVEVKLSDGTILSDVANLIGKPKFTTPSLIFHLPLDDRGYTVSIDYITMPKYVQKNHSIWDYYPKTKTII